MKNETPVQSVKYILIGITAVIADNIIFYITYRIIALPLLASTVMALVAGFLVSFFGNKIIVFKSTGTAATNSTGKQFAFYLVLLSVNMMYTYIFINLSTGLLPISAMLAKLITTVTIVLWNFIIYKYVIFK